MRSYSKQTLPRPHAFTHWRSQEAEISNSEWATFKEEISFKIQRTTNPLWKRAGRRINYRENLNEENWPKIKSIYGSKDRASKPSRKGEQQSPFNSQVAMKVTLGWKTLPQLILLDTRPRRDNGARRRHGVRPDQAEGKWWPVDRERNQDEQVTNISGTPPATSHISYSLTFAPTNTTDEFQTFVISIAKLNEKHGCFWLNSQPFGPGVKIPEFPFK